MERLLLLIFIFHPPLLFFINRKCAKPIDSVWITLISFLLGWALCFPVFILGLTKALGSSPVREAAFIALLCTVFGGWLISAIVHILWFPIITFFAVKNRKVRIIMGTIIFVYILLFSYINVYDRYDWGVPGNKLIHEGSTRAGFDSSQIQVFKAENDLLKLKLIRKWDLKSIHPKSFAAIGNDRPDWWPTREVLDNLEGHGLIIRSEEHYKSLRYDPDAQRLYVEWGYW